MADVLVKREGMPAKNKLLAAFSLMLVSALLALIMVPDQVDPLRYLASIDARVIKVIENNDERFVMYRARPGKIFMVREAYKKTGDTIRVNEYQRTLTRRVEYLVVR
jgi:hypothetical protein